MTGFCWCIVASEIDHIALANRNHDTLLFLCQDVEQHAEWVVTIAFYKAVQIVEAVYAAHRNSHSHSHDARIGDLKRTVYANLFKAYRPLYAASLVARYLEDSSERKVDSAGSSTVKKYHRFSDYMNPDDIVKRLLKKRLDVLEQHAAGFLSERGRNSLKRIGASGL